MKLKQTHQNQITRKKCPNNIQTKPKKWTTARSPKRRPIELVFRAARADMEPAFVLITNGNLDFELGDGARDNCRQWQHHRDQVEICFVHTPLIKQQPCQSSWPEVTPDKIVAGWAHLGNFFEKIQITPKVKLAQSIPDFDPKQFTDALQKFSAIERAAVKRSRCALNRLNE